MEGDRAHPVATELMEYTFVIWVSWVFRKQEIARLEGETGQCS